MAVALVLVGCGAGQVAQTSAQVTATGGAHGAAGSVLVRDAAITFTGEIAGDAVYRPGDDVPLQLTVVNQGTAPDRLVAVRSPVAAGASVVGDALLPGGHVLVVGYDEPIASATMPQQAEIEVTLTGVSVPIRSGLVYPVELVFERAGVLALELPVEVPDALPPRADDPGAGPGSVTETGSLVPDRPS
jgi:copper(I)-binding protein